MRLQVLRPPLCWDSGVACAVGLVHNTHDKKCSVRYAGFSDSRKPCAAILPNPRRMKLAEIVELCTQSGLRAPKGPHSQ